jgi:hypothetical protein
VFIRGRKHLALLDRMCLAQPRRDACAVETGGLEATELRYPPFGIDWKQKDRLWINAEKSAGCSRTEVAGEVAEWLKAPVLKTGVRETVPGVRIPPSPPSLKFSITYLPFYISLYIFAAKGQKRIQGLATPRAARDGFEVWVDSRQQAWRRERFLVAHEVMRLLTFY